MSIDIAEYVANSARVSLEGLDWEDARHAGLSDDEIFALGYFADIEIQTVMYMRDLLNTGRALDADTMAFLTVWNYEEYFHGAALERIMKTCGVNGRGDVQDVRSRVLIRERLEAQAARMLAVLTPERYVTLYLCWGAVNEYITVHGYSNMGRLSKNPVLAEVCRRIVTQERSHFGWYYASARERLAGSRSHQRYARWFMKKFWTPVGAGTKTRAEVERLFYYLSGGDPAAYAHRVDEKIERLPGLENLGLMKNYFGLHSAPVEAAVGH